MAEYPRVFGHAGFFCGFEPKWIARGPSLQEEYLMKWYQIAGDWQQFTDLVKAKWEKLTDEDLKTFSGQSEQLAGLLQQGMAMRENRLKKKSGSFH